MELTEMDGLGLKCGLLSLVLDSLPICVSRFIRGVNHYETRHQDFRICRHRGGGGRRLLFFLIKIERCHESPVGDFRAAIARMWPGNGLSCNRKIAVP